MRQANTVAWVLPTHLSNVNVVRFFLRAVGIALLCVLIALAFLIPIPGQTFLATATLNALHTLAFAVFAFTLDWYIARPRRKEYRDNGVAPHISTVLLCSTLLLFSLAVLSELIQPSTGRSYSTDDILRDFLGIAIGHIAFLLYRPSALTGASRLTLGITMLFLLLVGVSQPLWFWYLSTTKPAWPMLADFEHPRALAYIKTDGSESVSRVTAPTNWQDNQSEVIRIKKDLTPFSGFSLLEFESDWRALSHFDFDVFNPQDHTVELNLRINDTNHNNQYHDRFNHAFRLAPGATAITFAIDDMLTLGAPRDDGRIMDISSIDGLVFFMTLGSAGDTLYLDNIRVR